ncbi:MAG: HDOD domain-containing protein [Phycisphaerae bacterium]
MTELAVGASTAAGKADSLDRVAKRVVEISSLPQVALRVLEVAQNPDAGAADLKCVVEGDPSLSARLLRLINSAAYAVRSQITSLHQAISYLGFSQVRNLAMTASVADIFKQGAEIGPYKRSELWRHLLSVGLCARLVAMRNRMRNFDDAFLAGLLHDIGIILEDQHCHEQFEATMLALDGTKPLCEVERAQMGFDHTTLGAAIAEKWRFPAVVAVAIRHHHASEKYTGDGADVVRCVEIGNVICTLKGISSVGQKLLKPPTAAVQAFGFSKDDLIVLAKDLDQEISQNKGLFDL